MNDEPMQLCNLAGLTTSRKCNDKLTVYSLLDDLYTPSAYIIN